MPTGSVMGSSDRAECFSIAHAITTPAAVTADAIYREQEFHVGELPGTLTLPRGKAPFPVLVLVPGSGPADRDETIGPNKPFLDLAHGLAAQGIAVLRYDKRTYAMPGSRTGAQLSVDRETTDDAVAAVATLVTEPAIDGHHIYLLGHSQGAQLAPRIAARSGHIAGLVLLAAPARPVLDLLIDQLHYQLSLNDAQSASARANVTAIEAAVRSIRQQPPTGVADDSTALLGTPARYWRELEHVDPIADLAHLDLPVLWLQGGRDYQVTAPDWTLWRRALAGNANATTHLYPALNHLGIAGEGPPNPAEYRRPGHVDPALIADLADWLHAQH